MSHRGACSCDNLTGDGAGVMVAIPDQYYRNVLKQEHYIDLPQFGQYATGIIFMDSQSESDQEKIKQRLTVLAENLGLNVSIINLSTA